MNVKTKKKSFIAKAVTMLMTVFTLAIVMAFPISASAAEVPSVAEVPAVVEVVPISAANHFQNVQNVITNVAKFTPMPLEGAVGGASLGTQTDGDSQFQAVVEFFVKWIKRVGLLVAFVGGIMFGLAIKNNDADQKQAGLLTLVAGFVVSALCQAVDMFDIFS